MTSFAEGLVGITLDDRYRLDAVLGEGGMGAVFRATHLAMDRKVAVKLLKPHLANNEASLERFKREARSTMKVDSPHVVKVLDYGITPQRDYYMVLEYLDGRTVQRELDVDGMFTPARVVHVARQALHGLGAAHAIGLVHRDIKPDNILLMRYGTDADYTKVLDFGVAKLMEGAAKSTQSQLALTQLGTVFGTPEFMSPEQACGHLLDGRSDLYSLAATLFAMLTGCGLFDADSTIEWLTQHVRTAPPRLRMLRPELATYPELDEVIQACLAKNRDQRPRSAAELDELFARIEPTLQRPMGASPGTSKVKVFSSSMFFDALPLDAVDPGETLLPSAGISLQHIDAHTVDTVPLRPMVPKRRGLLLGVIALVVLGMMSVAIGVVVTKKKAPTGSPETTVAVTPADSAAAPPSRDAAPADALPDTATMPADAAERPRPDAAVSGSNKPPTAISNEALKFLAAAEAAAVVNDAFTELANAQAALEAPGALPPARKLRARYLYCDGLVGTAGNLVRGCKCLRDLRNNLAARRAKAAGCPD